MSFFTLLPVRATALVAFATLSLSAVPVLGQTRGFAPEVGAIANCAPGSTACYARRDADCRSTGGFLSLTMISGTTVALECLNDRAQVEQIFAASHATTGACTVGRLCTRQAPRTGLQNSVYGQMVGMMNTCAQSHGRLHVHAIFADQGNLSTVYAGCVPTA